MKLHLMNRLGLLGTCTVAVLFLQVAALAVDRVAAPVSLKQAEGNQTVRTATPAQKELMANATREGYAIEWDGALAVPRSIRGENLAGAQSFSSGHGLVVGGKGDYAADAVAVMDRLAGLFRIADASQEFAVRNMHGDQLGSHHVRLQQNYQGLTVVGGDLVVHFDHEDKAYQVNGRYVPDLDLVVTPSISADEAILAARQDLAALKLPEAGCQAEPTLVIYARLDPPRLAYEMTLVYDDCEGTPGRWRYWVDALSGIVLQRFNDIQSIPAPSGSGATTTITGSILEGEGGGVTNVQGWYDAVRTNYYLHNTGLVWIVENVASNGYPDNGTYAHRGTNNWGSSDPAEMSVAVNMDLTLRYFRERHARFSYDNAGILARSFIHEGNSYVNAFWDGVGFSFGDGDGITARCLATLDICGHEFTHAVTSYSSGLVYAQESGALNESFSDIFGTCVEFFGQTDDRASYPVENPGQADWMMGEDSWLSSVTLRDLRSPSNTVTVGTGKQQPTRYQGTYWDPYEEVHQNSGVQNFFFYLLSEGGSGNNDGIMYNLTGIGITNAEQIAYRALTVYCTPDTGYNAARGAWMSAAMDLNPAWVSAVAETWDAVGVRAVYIVPTGDAAFSGAEGGPFTPSTFIYKVTNANASAVGWGVDHTQSWVTVSPVSGSIPGLGVQSVTVTLHAATLSLPLGLYEDTLVFTNTSSAGSDSRQVTLQILPPTIFSFDLNTDPGWSTEGQWAYGTPLGFEGDPASGATGTKVYGYNLAGKYANGIPAYALTTPPLDCSAYENLKISFMRWLGLESSTFDHAALQASSNGVDWVDLWTHTGGSFQESAWQSLVYDLDLGDWQGPIQVRWVMGTTDSSVTYSGWNLDDIRIHGTARDAMRIDPTLGWTSQGFAGGSFSQTNMNYSVTNGGVGSFAWRVSTTSSWLSLSSTGGVLSVAATSTVSMALNASASSLGVGVYTADAVFSNVNSGVSYARTVTLTVKGDMAFDDTSFDVGEGDGSGLVTILRDGHTNLAVNVQIFTSNGTATAGSDYTATNATLSFAPGDMAKSFTVSVLDDGTSEVPESIYVILSNPTGGGLLGTPSITSLMIQDDDGVVLALPHYLYDGGAYQWDIQTNGSIATGSSDAYDAAHVLSGFPSFTTGLLVGARQFVVGPAVTGTVQITRKIFVPTEHNFCRFLEVLKNVGPTAVTYRVRIDSDMGSDNASVVDSTSTGDGVFSVDDRWIVTDDADGSGDPSIAHVIANAYGQIRPAAVSYASGQVGYEYNVPLNPGQTRIVMHFGAQNQNRAQARSNAGTLTSLGSDALQMMTPAEISQLANFGMINSADILITDEDTWLYHNTGALPGLGWQGTSFSDGSWSNGLAPLGYGDPVNTTLSYGSLSTNKWAAYYFRKHISISNAASVTGLIGSFVADDGAVIYLNGTRIHATTNIIEPVGNESWTSGAAPEPLVSHEFSINPSLLITGDNVLAAEVHQVGPGSSDMFFDMSLVKVPFATTNQVGLAALDNWTAYNDTAWQSDDVVNVTGSYTTNNPGVLSNGVLVAEGGQTLTGRTVSMATNASAFNFMALGGTVSNVLPVGTDAALEFAGHIGNGYSCEIQGAAPLATVTVTLGGLNSNKQYKLVVWSSRLADNPSYSNRYSDVVLSGMDSFTNTSTVTDGVTRFTTTMTQDSTTLRAVLRTGYGPVARFEQIRTGTDGTIVFKVSRSASSTGNGYFNAFKLVESDVVIAGAGDSDSDGMPDYWESRYFGGSTNASGSVDSDGDGLLNQEEYLTGTSPTNAGSCFQIIGFTRQGGSNQLLWIGGTNGPISPYGIVQGTSLSSGVWSPVGTQPRQEGTNAWSSAAPSNSRYYYRISATN